MIATQKSQEQAYSLGTTTDTNDRFVVDPAALRPSFFASFGRTTTQSSAATTPCVTPKRNRSQTIAPPPSGRFHVATTLEEVVNAWSLTYNVYSTNGFIDPNQHKIHTVPQAINSNTAVFYSTSGSNVDGTLTAMLDGPNGLPLDTVYKVELDLLRRQGRRLNEHGLLAHMTQIDASQATHSARQQADQVRTSLIHLMCRTVRFGLAMNCTDIVIGVHPKHMRFYQRAWGFKQAGPERAYATVNDRPVVLMRLDYSEVIRREELPYAYDFLLNNPIPLESVLQGYDFDLRDFTRSSLPLHAYLRDKYPMWERPIARFMRKAG